MKASELIKIIQNAMEESKTDFEVVCRIKNYERHTVVDGKSPNETINVYDGVGIIKFIAKEY